MPFLPIKSFCRLLLTLGLLATTLWSNAVIAAEKINVVASFSILGDLTQRIGGERIQVHTLVGRNADAHVYQPTPADARTIAQARLVIVNGFGFEGWIDRLIKSSGYRGQVLTASNGIKVLRRPRAANQPEHDGAIDPHAWQDLANVLVFVDNISQELSKTDPDGKSVYLANAAKYKQEINALDLEIRKAFDSIPEDRRKVVTSHDAFGYFGRAYRISFIAPIGVNTDGEPSAADVGRIIKQIRREKIPAMFMENFSDSRLLERIRQESGARIGGTLFSDSLSNSNGPAATYLEMMRHNAKVLETALLKPERQN
ncbi:MAG: metal ABC transporter substrate-binding protein [Betaproteobacteria bacterium]